MDPVGVPRLVVFGFPHCRRSLLDARDRSPLRLGMIDGGVVVDSYPLSSTIV